MRWTPHLDALLDGRTVDDDTVAALHAACAATDASVGTAVAVLQLLASMADRHGDVWPSVSTLCEALPWFSRRAVERALAALHTAGLAVTDGRYRGRARVRRLVVDGAPPTPTHLPSPVDEPTSATPGGSRLVDEPTTSARTSARTSATVGGQKEEVGRTTPLTPTAAPRRGLRALGANPRARLAAALVAAQPLPRVPHPWAGPPGDVCTACGLPEHNRHHQPRPLAVDRWPAMAGVA